MNTEMVMLVADDTLSMHRPEVRRRIDITLAPVAPITCWPPGARAVATLASGDCRWPLGEIVDEGFTFCGSPRQRGAYCAHHASLSRAGGCRA